MRIWPCAAGDVLAAPPRRDCRFGFDGVGRCAFLMARWSIPACAIHASLHRGSHAVAVDAVPGQTTRPDVLGSKVEADSSQIRAGSRDLRFAPCVANNEEVQRYMYGMWIKLQALAAAGECRPPKAVWSIAPELCSLAPASSAVIRCRSFLAELAGAIQDRVSVQPLRCTGSACRPIRQVATP